MATFADAAFLFSVIVFVFALLPALVADRRVRRGRDTLLTLTLDLSDAHGAEPGHLH